MKKLKAKPVTSLLLASTIAFTGSFQLYSLSKEIDALKKQHRDLQKSHHSLSVKYKKLQRHYKQSLDDISDLEKRNHELQKQNEQLQQQNDELQKQIRIHQDHIRQLKKDLQAKNEKHSKAHFSLASRGQKEGEWIYFWATYYDANEQSTGKNPGDPGYGITKSGKPVQAGVTIAVDPRIIPLGTWVLIQYPDGRIEKRQAQDTGSAIKGYRIDIYLPKASITSGSHLVKVKILD
jgi:3D (Asp-Asp-Asp) domain-containing protein/chaperonin cofactor prefoldin